MDTYTDKINKFKTRSQSGFSLMEILIVIALIAALAGVMISQLDNMLGGGQEGVVEIFIDNIETPLMTYRLNVGSYPKTDQGLKALLNAPSGANAKRWKGPYIKEEPIDPWGNPYQYRSPGTHNPKTYDVWSYGPNGQEGGGDDIGNWK